jgi:hypothetical protein
MNDGAGAPDATPKKRGAAKGTLDAWVETGRIPPEPVQRPKGPATIGAGLRWAALQRDHHKCVICGRSPAKDPSVELHVDHIIPVSKGGLTTADNLQVVPAKWDRSKSNKHTQRFWV